MSQQNATPLIAVALGLIIGGVSGFYIREYAITSKDVPAGSRPAGMMGGGGPPAGMGGMGGMGGGGFGGGNTNSGGLALARLVRNLDQIQQSQGKGITPDQGKTLLPILQKVKAAATLPAAEADKQIAAIQGALTEDQKKVLEGMQQGGFGGGRGGGGGGMMGGMGGPPGGGMGGPPGGAMPGGPGGGPSGPPGGAGPGGGPPGSAPANAPGGPGGPGGPPGGMGGMGGMGGGRPDPEKPFANERNQKALDSLIAGLGKS